MRTMTSFSTVMCKTVMDHKRKWKGNNNIQATFKQQTLSTNELPISGYPFPSPTPQAKSVKRTSHAYPLDPIFPKSSFQSKTSTFLLGASATLGLGARLCGQGRLGSTWIRKEKSTYIQRFCGLCGLLLTIVLPVKEVERWIAK
jgi:hypothetical protein